MQARARNRLLAILGALGFCIIVSIVVYRQHHHVAVYQGKTIEAWLLQLSDPDPKTRSAAEAVFDTLGTNAVPELTRLLLAEDARWRKLVWSHGNWPSRRLRLLLLRRVRPPNSYRVHPAAARALARLGPGAAAAEPVLVRALQDKVNGTYWEAGTALGRIGKPAVPDLIHALEDSDTLVRCAAAHGLGEAGPDAAPAVPALLRLLKQGTTNEQQIAAQSLAKIGALPRQTRTTDGRSAAELQRK